MTSPRLGPVGLALLCSLVYAGAATADTPAVSPDTTLTCEEGYQGRLFALQMSTRGQYVWTTRVDLKGPSDELLRPFQEPGDERLAVRASALHLELNPRSCTISKSDRAHFVECPRATDDAISTKWSKVSFTGDGTSALGTGQTVDVVRTLKIASVTLHAEVQSKQGSLGPEDRVVATLTVNALVGGQPRTLKLTRDLGEWTSKVDRSNNDRCVVTAE